MDIEAFISSVFAKRPLWDQKDSQHHNRFILDKLWDAVGNEMGSTRNVMRAKWKTLRDTFRKEMKKMPVKRSGDGASQSTWKSSWQYFESLYFLRDQFTARISSGNLPDVEQPCTENEETNVELPELNSQAKDDTIHVDQPPVTSPLQMNIRELNASTPAKGLKRKQQNDSDVGTALIRIEENKLRILENQHKKITDEDESFFQSLLPHIRTLTPQNKMLLRIKMQELVYNFVYGCQPPDKNVGTITTPAQNISHRYQNTQLTNLQTVTQDYSNPTSVTSYLSSFSDESHHDIY